MEEELSPKEDETWEFLKLDGADELDAEVCISPKVTDCEHDEINNKEAIDNKATESDKECETNSTRDSMMSPEKKLPNPSNLLQYGGNVSVMKLMAKYEENCGSEKSCVPYELNFPSNLGNKYTKNEEYHNKLTDNFTNLHQKFQGSCIFRSKQNNLIKTDHDTPLNRYKIRRNIFPKKKNEIPLYSTAIKKKPYLPKFRIPEAVQNFNIANIECSEPYYPSIYNSSETSDFPKKEKVVKPAKKNYSWADMVIRVLASGAIGFALGFLFGSWLKETSHICTVWDIQFDPQMF